MQNNPQAGGPGRRRAGPPPAAAVTGTPGRATVANKCRKWPATVGSATVTVQLPGCHCQPEHRRSAAGGPARLGPTRNQRELGTSGSGPGAA